MRTSSNSAGGFGAQLPKGTETQPHTASQGWGTQGHKHRVPILLFSFPQEESKNFVSSSRRKQYGSSEYLSQADTAGRRAVPTLELQDPTSSPSAPPGLQAEDQVCGSEEK